MKTQIAGRPNQPLGGTGKWLRRLAWLALTVGIVLQGPDGGLRDPGSRERVLAFCLMAFAGYWFLAGLWARRRHVAAIPGRLGAAHETSLQPAPHH